MSRKTIEDCLDDFYRENGPCCAGCDYWRYHNAVVGDCIRTAPDYSGRERLAMIGLRCCSADVGPGHAITMRGHWCGEFKDEPEPEEHHQ